MATSTEQCNCMRIRGRGQQKKRNYLCLWLPTGELPKEKRMNDSLIFTVILNSRGGSFSMFSIWAFFCTESWVYHSQNGLQDLPHPTITDGQSGFNIGFDSSNGGNTFPSSSVLLLVIHLRINSYKSRWYV